MLPSETDLQLLFAELNYQHFNGEVPAHRIAYNARFSNSAGRISYSARPPLIELSLKHMRRNPQAIRETLLHEMIHGWLFARNRDPGHGPAFKKKMREVGITSIYHDLGSARPVNESAKRYILRCERCAMELLRKRRPSAPTSCGRCSRRGFDARFPLSIFEVVETLALGDALGQAAQAKKPADCD
ncbi:MAG: SprT-like domain-containing protein [Candidatus Eremiobacteraeota bacterium]|nr:SprT-like domain-containing protein [Candidatus Eremiobacteraeota bacterium]